jgi:uncharacterized protein (TIGR03437 family)
MALRRVKRALLSVSFLSLSWIVVAPVRAQSPQPAPFIPNQYILLLEDAPVAARFASREQMRTAAAVAYRQQVETKQAAVLKELAARNIRVLGSVSVLVNAIFVSAPASRVAELQSIPGVIGVRPVRRFKKALNRATQLMNAPAAWNAVGGMSNGGKGIKIAILDSGIDQTHPAFQDSTLTMPAGFPICTYGHPEDCAYTTNKVIVARSYVRMLAAGSDPKNPALDSMPDDYSPRDRDGHGTAVASCAAANSTATPAITTSGGPLTISGMAPKAYLGNYKITGSPGVLDGASDPVLIQAIGDALTDGMDIASLSVVGPAFTGALDTGAICGLPNGPNNYCDPVAAAYEAAVKAGMVVVVAAGNDGYNGYYYPMFNSINSPATAPSVIGVGATVNSHVFNPSVTVVGPGAPSSLQGIAAQNSDAIFPYANNPSYGASDAVFPAVTAPLIDVTQKGDTGYACTSLPAGSLNGAFALIERGPAGSSGCTFNTKVTNAEAAGAVGVILYMYDSSATVSPEGMGFSSANPLIGPVVMISNAAGLALKQYIDQNPLPTLVTIDTAGIEEDMTIYDQVAQITVTANQFAGYSSMGPTPDGAIKPDLVATSGFDTDSYDLGPDYNDPDLPVPGALYVAAQNFDPNGDLFSTSRYLTIAAGTSFATPMTAGSAALVKQAHPSYTPTQIKSALVNAASQTTTTDEFGDTVDVEWIGAGRVDAGAAVNASVTAEPSTISFGYVKSGGLPIAKPITITNHGSSSVTLAISVACCSVNASATKAVSGVSITTNPAQTLTLAAGPGATLTVTLSGTVPAASEYSGAVTLQGSGITVRIPFMFLVGSGVANNLNFVVGTGLEGAPGEDLGGFPMVQVVDQYGVPVVGAAVSLSVSQAGSLTLKSVPGEPACSPNNSTTVTSCNTDNYGFAWVDVVLGAQAASPTINVTAAGVTNQIGVYIVAPPTINTGGVVNAAPDSQSPIAPGSYVSIYGTNLVDTDYLINPTGDGPTLTTANDLPLVIDGTTVSFDVPSAGISVPGYLTFVGPGQINAQVPWELAGQSSVEIKVTVDDGTLFGNVVTVPLAQYTPAFFVGDGTIAALDAVTYAYILTTNPAHSGEILSLFANGLGPVTNQPASGAPAPGGPNLANTTTQPVVMIGGQQAQISFWGLAPGYPGLYQINATVPAGLTGNQQVTVSIGGQTSPAVTLPVH